MAKHYISFENILKFFSAAFPYILISFVILVYLFVIFINRLDLAIRGLYIAAPILIASIIALKAPNFDFALKEPLIRLNKQQILISILAFAALYVLATLLLLIYSPRIVAYFIIISLIFCIISIQIFSISFDNKILEKIIIIEIFLVLLNQIWGVTLKYPLFFGYTDIFFHMDWVDSIVNTGFVTESFGFYQFFPLYHVFAAEGILISNFELKNGFYIILGIAYLSSGLFAYLFFQIITKNFRISLFCLLIFSYSKDVIFHGMYMVTRSMAFIFMIVIIYLLLRKKEMVFKFILLIFTASIILTHQITLVYMTMILITILVINRCIYAYNEEKRLSLNFISLLIVAFLSYWFFVAYDFSTMAFRSFETKIDNDTVISEVLPPENILIFLQTHTEFILFIFFVLIGIATLLKANTIDKDLVFISFLSFFFLPFYISGIITLIPQLKAGLLSYRLPLMTIIFLIIPLVYGILIFYKLLSQNFKTKRMPITIILILVTTYSFFSIANPMTSADNNIFASNFNANTPYFTENEMAAFSFVKNKTLKSELYSDYQTSRYLETNYNIYRIEKPNIDYINSGYLILRSKELQDRSLTFGSNETTYSYKLNSKESSNKSILTYLDRKNKIYTSTDVNLYYFKKT